MLIDTHAHLDFDAFDGDREAVLARARGTGVAAVINPGCDIPTSQAACDLAAEHPGYVYAAAGIHPNNTADASPGDIRLLAEIVRNEPVVAVGEIGLDYYRDRAPRDRQARIFAGQLELARDAGLPVIIHFRNVERDGVEVVGEDLLRSVRGVFHCYGGSPAFAKELVGWGFYIGFDGPLTYRNSDRADVARSVPLERSLIETDSPYLTPQRHRGSRNEPAYVREIAETLAGVHSVSVDEAIAVTGRNACELFGIESSG